MRIKTVAIIGLGLIGASLAMALKKKKVPVNVIGKSGHAATVRKALKRKIINKGTMDIKEAVVDADLVIICTPINRIINMLKQIAPHLKKDAIVTDVGSTKSQIVKAAERIMPKRAHFVGGHPMAGTEHTGIDWAFPELFDGRPYILAVTKRTSRKALFTLEKFLKKLRLNVLRLSPEEQDTLVAGISHLPLAVAASLTSTIAAMPRRNRFSRVASSGFRDTTRIASGSPVLGVDLFTTNKKAVLKMINSFKLSLRSLESAIKSGNAKRVSKILSSAKKFRDRVCSK